MTGRVYVLVAEVAEESQLLIAPSGVSGAVNIEDEHFGLVVLMELDVLFGEQPGEPGSLSGDGRVFEARKSRGGQASAFPSLRARVWGWAGYGGRCGRWRPGSQR